jgi:hypothetical protein
MTTEATTTQTSDPKRFILSETIQAAGFPLTPEQATILDLAQTLHRKFLWSATISIRQLERIAQRYHNMSFDDVARIIQELTDAGIVAGFRRSDGSATVRLLLRFRGPDFHGDGSTDPAIGVLVERRYTLRQLADLSETRLRLFGERQGQSTAAAMILLAVHQNAHIDQIGIVKLRKFCCENEMTAAEFQSGCTELEAAGLLTFYRAANDLLTAKLTSMVETAVRLTAADLEAELMPAA